MFRKLCLLTFYSLLLTFASANINFKELTGNSFSEFLDENDLTIIFAFLPKCASCKIAINFQNELLTNLDDANSEIGFGTIDRTTFKAPLESLQLNTFPTFRIYQNPDCYVDYSGPIEKNRIFQWIQQVYRKNDVSIRLKTRKDVLQFNTLFLALHLKMPSNDSKALLKLKIVQRLLPEIPVYHSFEEDAPLDTDNPNPPGTYTLTIQRTFDDGPKSLSSTALFTCHVLFEFAFALKSQSYQRMNEQNAVEMLKYQKTTCLLFDTNLNSEISQTFKGLALEKNDEMEFLWSDLTESNSEPFAHMFGIQQSDFPAILILDFRNGKYVKYRKLKIGPENVIKFYEDFKTGKLREFFRSEAEPIQRDERVLSIVWDNYDLILKSDFSIFVAFVSDKCQFCIEIIDAIFNASKQILSDKNLRFGIMNVDRNEVPPAIDLKRIPAAYLYKSLDKKNPVKFELMRNAEVVINFIEKHLNDRFFETRVPKIVRDINDLYFQGGVKQTNQTKTGPTNSDEVNEDEKMDEIDL